MASAIAIAMPTCSFCLSSLSQSSSTRKQSIWRISNSAVSLTQVSNFEFFKWIPQLGFCQFSQWNGLKNLGISTSQLNVKIERRGRYKGKGVYASLFGVGAPEALVIGVVALLVFGPKGLAEVARNLGKTLRAFQPTIRELQDVSREFKSTLEREIGLDDIQASNQNKYDSSISRNPSSPSPNSGTEASQKEIDPNGSLSPSKAYSTEDYLKITEEQLKVASASQQQNDNASPGDESPLEIQAESQGAHSEQAASAMPLSGKTENEK